MWVQAVGSNLRGSSLLMVRGTSLFLWRATCKRNRRVAPGYNQSRSKSRHYIRKSTRMLRSLLSPGSGLGKGRGSGSAKYNSAKCIGNCRQPSLYY